jgi:hypothetical protein
MVKDAPHGDRSCVHERQCSKKTVPSIFPPPVAHVKVTSPPA